MIYGRYPNRDQSYSSSGEKTLDYGSRPAPPRNTAAHTNAPPKRSTSRSSDHPSPRSGAGEGLARCRVTSVRPPGPARVAHPYKFSHSIPFSIPYSVPYSNHVFHSIFRSIHIPIDIPFNFSKLFRFHFPSHCIPYYAIFHSTFHFSNPIPFHSPKFRSVFHPIPSRRVDPEKVQNTHGEGTTNIARGAAAGEKGLGGTRHGGGGWDTFRGVFVSFRHTAPGTRRVFYYLMAFGFVRQYLQQ